MISTQAILYTQSNNAKTDTVSEKENVYIGEIGDSYYVR